MGMRLGSQWSGNEARESVDGNEVGSQWSGNEARESVVWE